jgi:hypothetical protein
MLRVNFLVQQGNRRRLKDRRGDILSVNAMMRDDASAAGRWPWLQLERAASANAANILLQRNHETDNTGNGKSTHFNVVSEEYLYFQPAPGLYGLLGCFPCPKLRVPMRHQPAINAQHLVHLRK